MKIAVAVLCLTTLVCIESALVFDSSLEVHWQNFKEVFHKQYSAAEERARKLIWVNNVAKIIRHNLDFDLGKHSFQKGLNEYADMSHHEFVQTMNGYRQFFKNDNDASTFVQPSNVVIPDTVDWRKEGLVTGIKNQGQCGSCWAFSTTGSLEGQHKKKTGELGSLSEQNLVDCSGPEGNMGCNGGWMDQGFEYIQKNGGIDTEQAYPYTAEVGTCNYKPSSSGASCTGFVDIPAGDENALKVAVATAGPVSVAIDAGHESFQLYSGGIYDEPSCTTDELDHAVLAIGYGTEDGQDYWLVKNSWGTSWGENGYIRMSRNKNNQCGIASKASYPLV